MFEHLCGITPSLCYRDIALLFFHAKMELTDVQRQFALLLERRQEFIGVNADEYLRVKQELADCHRKLCIAQKFQAEWPRMSQALAATAATDAKNRQLTEENLQLKEALARMSASTVPVFEI